MWPRLSLTKTDNRKEFIMCRKGSALFLGALVLSVVCTLCVANVWAQGSKIIRVTGSKYVSYGVLDLARPFMERNRDLRVEVTCAEPDAAITSLKEKSAHAVMTFGELEQDQVQGAEEQGVQLVKQVIGWGAVALIVSRDNPINALTIDQVKKIFSGEYKNWEQVGGPKQPIVIMTRDEQISGTEMIFRNAMLDGSPFPENSVKVFDHDIIRAVWKEKGAVGDARATEAFRGQMKGMVKVLGLKGNDNSPPLMPSLENAQNNSYPISAPLILYYDKRTNPNLGSGFIEFCARRGIDSMFSQLNEGPGSNQ
jgi:phosphate transport system substrate-binding protein